MYVNDQTLYKQLKKRLCTAKYVLVDGRLLRSRGEVILFILT